MSSITKQWLDDTGFERVQIDGNPYMADIYRLVPYNFELFAVMPHQSYNVPFVQLRMGGIAGRQLGVNLHDVEDVETLIKTLTGEK